MRLVDACWGAELTQALQADTSALRIISLFVKLQGKAGLRVRLHVAFDTLGTVPSAVLVAIQP